MDSPSSSNSHEDEPARVTPSLALSRTESILLSASGDVLVCRCRQASTPRQSAAPGWQQDVAALCCDNECDDLTVQVQEAAVCSPWGRSSYADEKKQGDFPRMRGGLLGGAPAQVAASPLSERRYQQQNSLVRKEPLGVLSENDKNSPNRAQRAFRSQPLPLMGEFDEESIAPLRSFDYSHFSDGGNDMIPSPRSSHVSVPVPIPEEETVASGDHAILESSPLMHGIPAFHKGFAQVRITQVSAHPLGSHVLLISDAALLYAYGLNDYGQLGIGMRNTGRGLRRFVMSPTIVTPLVEHGGKAILAAAGVSHSLVVVLTEERRLVRSQSMDTFRKQRGQSIETSRVHHQLYGFGRNDYMKIGLFNPKVSPAGAEDEMDCVVLPRRVALRCKFRPDENVEEPQGVFGLAAGVEHSAALLRKPTGEVELYTWGHASHGALGLLKPSVSSSPDVRIVPVPSFVASLSRSSHPAAQPASLLFPTEVPCQVALARQASYVVTSAGRCFAFGTSDEGMLGLGADVCTTDRPMDMGLERVVSISAGAQHVLAVTSSQQVYAWGTRSHAGLPPPRRDEERDLVAWTPTLLSLPTPVLQAHAGTDNSLFVSTSGNVLSCGEPSGRLGQGEVESLIRKPIPLFGGLCLFKSEATRANASV